MITRIDGRPVDDPDDLSRAVALLDPGTTVTGRGVARRRAPRPCRSSSATGRSAAVRRRLSRAPGFRGIVSAARAPARRPRPQEPRRLHAHRRPAARRGDPRARRAAAGQARRPPLRDRVRRRRLGDPLHARAADARRRARGRVAGHLRPRGVLQRDQADAQRAAGQPAGPHRGAVGDLGAVQRDERARAVGRLGRLRRPRPAARGAALARAREGARLDLALPHRRLDAQPGDDGAAAAVPPGLPRVALPRRRLRARRDGRRRQHRAAGDRPARAEEHGALARGRRVRLRAVRDRHRRGR